MVVLSLQTGKVRTHQDADGNSYSTATFKDAIAGPLRLDVEGFEGDEHGNRKVHGGPDKAALVYSHDHYSFWEEVFGRSLQPGAFGENILISGTTEKEVCVGDTYELGSAIVQIAQPRKPCVTQARRWNMPDLIARMSKANRCGWYLRILQPGMVTAGDSFRLTDRPHPEWTVAEAFYTFTYRKKDRDAMTRLYELPSLAVAWKREIAEKHLAAV